MGFTSSTVITRLRGTLQGVGGDPYYTSLCVDVESGSVDLEVGGWRQVWEAFDTTIVDDASFTPDDIHPQINVATGVTVGFSDSDEDPVVFTGTGAALPFSTQIYVSLHTGEVVNGRELRGGFYAPEISANTLVNGRLHPDTVAGLNGALQTAFFDAGALNNSALVYSPTHGVAAYVTSVSVKSDYGVLRSRRD